MFPVRTHQVVNIFASQEFVLKINVSNWEINEDLMEIQEQKP